MRAAVCIFLFAAVAAEVLEVIVVDSKSSFPSERELDPKYVIGMVDGITTKPAVRPGARMVQMTSADGARFKCYIPVRASTRSLSLFLVSTLSSLCVCLSLSLSLVSLSYLSKERELGV